MRAMRRSDRQVTDSAEILQMIQASKVCRIGMQDAEGLYIVPLNFGYTFTPAQQPDAPPAQAGQQAAFGQGLTLYFHSASSGRKIDALRQNPQVCFEMDGAHALMESDILTEYSFAYQSIIGSGTVRFVEDPAARMAAMVAIMRQQSGLSEAEILAMPRQEHWMQPAVMTVFALDVSSLTAKKHGKKGV